MGKDKTALYEVAEKKYDELNKRVREMDDNCRIVSYSYFEQELKILAGKVLTIIDASIADKQQNKCVKDLIKSEFHRRINDLQEFYWNGTRGHGVNFENDTCPVPLN